MQIILVRHGHPMVPTSGPTTNPPLSERGHMQARCVAEALGSEAIEAIWSSGLQRADATAEPLARALGLKIQSLPGLGEVDRDGSDYANIEMIRQKGKAEWQRFLAGPLEYFGKDPSQFRAETLEAFGHILESGLTGKVAIFSHGFPINILLSHILGLNHDARFAPSYGSITRLSGHRLSSLTVVSINETGHVPETRR